MTGAPTPEITLQNGRLRVAILPHEGARISSIFDTESETEFLLQAAHPYRKPDTLDRWSHFDDSACAGIDECLPSVSADGPEAPGGPIPDHGDFWRLDWIETEPATRNTVALAASGYSRPILFEKGLHLSASALRIQYRIRNQGGSPLPFLYAFHPLLAIDAGDRILLPPEISSVRVESSRSNRLGRPGSSIGWPTPQGADASLDLSRTERISAASADMLYTGQLHSGWCGLYRAQSGQGMILRFDPHLLPYLGLWLCYGGWPDDATCPRQYAVAFEPTVAPWGTLSAAWKNHQAPILAAHASFAFSILLHCIGPGRLTYDEFAVQCIRAAAFE
jgi:galactose mutarotase-like enzyme